MAPLRVRSRQRRLLIRVSAKRKSNRTRCHVVDLPQPERPPADSRRRHIIESFFKSSIGGQGAVPKDDAWVMPNISQDGRTANAGPALNFNFRTCQIPFDEEVAAQLVRACRVCYAQGGSFWMPCGASPRCLPESLAASLFAHHSSNATFDASGSGAEWWAQVRKNGNPKKAIKFHWDADEFAVEQHGINMHPHFSTVTYLTNCGAPTLVVDRRNPLKMEGGKTPCGSIHRGLLCYPSLGEHIVFDGQFLHGNVPGLGQDGERVTFLVNVWFNHRPSNCHRLSESIGQYLGCPDTVPVPTPLEVPRKSIVLPSENVFKTKFAWRTRHLSLCVPLPLSHDTAVLDWTDGAELCEA